jgi:[acyl-carrier-protein] S-malonyltransferase
MARAFVFPGQGSQAIGMGRALAEAYPEARAVFDEVDEALGEKLSALIAEGPEERLTLTENAQPALMATSLAAMRALEAEGVSVAGHATFVAGHSLGEYSALCAAGAFTVADAARLLRLRGRAMQAAAPVGAGAMAALIGLDADAARAVAAEAAAGEVCEAANDNAPGQVVVSGARAAIERAVEIAKARGAKRAILLPVSAPFHCAMMAPAAEAMRAALAETRIARPAAPVVSNVKAEGVDEPEEIRALLVAQVTGAVRWREGVEWMAARGVAELVEIGAGKVLTGLAKRIVPSLSAIAVGAPAEVAAAAAAIRG